MDISRNSPLWAFIFNKSRKRRDKTTILGSIPLFEKLSRWELRAIADIVHQRVYAEGEFVFRKGQPGAAMFVITTGEVKIIDHDRENRDTVIATLGANAFFGELALLDDSPRSASAMAAAGTEIYAFFRTDLDRLFAATPQIGLEVYRALAGIIGTRLKVTNEHLSHK
ncbi:MAG: cyclic nucleotide-binding domain-containing protein [Proteobacteria bacterium]|nr:cyclic nucleotide-binding domain-containing protein [Pseudomonadota bacterium]MBU1736998.1 cyclic nucleotide-binding domain-containing protein [Pseudomonadota bacterium]